MFDKDNKFGFINNNENSNNNIEGLDKVKADINNVKNDLGNEELTTINKDVKGAINELNTQYKEIENTKASKQEIKNKLLNSAYTTLDGRNLFLKYNGITLLTLPLNNLLNIENYNKTEGDYTININNGIITVNGTINNHIYIKLTNGTDVGVGESGGDKKSTWSNESYKLEKNKKYYLMSTKTGSVKDLYTSQDCISKIVLSARDSNYTKILADSTPSEVNGNISYIQLYLQPGIYNNLEIISTLTKNSQIQSSLPSNMNGILKKEITGTYHNAIQGACSDGTYIYCGIVQNQSDTDNTILYKINSTTWDVEKNVSDFSLGHCNSMTYCKEDGYIHCISLDKSSTIYRITTDLVYVDSYNLDTSTISGFDKFGAIDYDSSLKQFILQIRGIQRGYAFYTKDRQLIDIKYTDEITGYHAYGGFCVDQQYIYQVIYYTDGTSGIVIYNYDGALLEEMKINNFTDELEEPLFINGKMYCSACQLNYTNSSIWEITY